MFRAITRRLRHHARPSSAAVVPVDTAPAAPEDCGSARMLIAAAMLALLHLMSDELNWTSSDQSTAEELRPGRRTRRFIAFVVTEIAVAANVAGCAIAFLRHDSGLVVLTAVIAGSLMLSVSLLARFPLSPASFRPSSRRPASGSRDHGWPCKAGWLPPRTRLSAVRGCP